MMEMINLAPSSLLLGTSAWLFCSILSVLSPSTPRRAPPCLLSSEGPGRRFPDWETTMTNSFFSLLTLISIIQSAQFCLSLSGSGSFTVFNQGQSPYSKPFLSSAHGSIWLPQVLMNYSSALALLNPMVLLSSHLMKWGTETNPD